MAANDLYVCVIVGCNKNRPEVLDLVPADKLVEFLTAVNGGKPAEKQADLENDEIDGLELQVFNVPNTTHKFFQSICDCQRKTLVFCIPKGNSTVLEIYRDICVDYWV